MVGFLAETISCTTEAVCNYIKQLWFRQQICSAHTQVMHSALCLALSKQTRQSPFLLLPALCCQAAGGDLDGTIGVAAAWVLLYTAAHILDDIEDGEIVQDASLKVNAATSLIFTAFNALIGLQTSGVAERVLCDVVEDFASTALRACSGQHADLTTATSSLEQCWKIGEAKSGDCFALACRAGAKLANARDEVVTCYSQFGYHLGMVIQIRDDLQDMYSQAKGRSDLVVGKRTLPIMYALTVTPLPIQERLLEALQAAAQSSTEEAVARRLIEESGAVLYLAVEAQRHYRQAQAILCAAKPLESPKQQLVAFLSESMPAFAQ
jgi:geranylgeranyl pyrophosphate synthase